uniref:MARVEL domain-containing protein n=1 Tax=Globisporangium ultimum (strain ATCC 200006 / CBS 805.95 / DAOM BR144) TaxID=431595 RepID=K3WS84_GLOUD
MAMARGGSSPLMFWLRLLLRFLQFAFSLIALITLSAAFVASSYYGYTSMLGSSPVIFTTLMTYTGFVYALWFLIFINLLNMCPRPPLFYEQLMDFLMAVLLLIAAIVLLCSDYVQNCSVYGYMLRCRSIRTSVVFTFLAMASFLLTLLLSFFDRGKDREDVNDDRHRMAAARNSDGPAPAPYHAESTPTARGDNNVAARV